MSSGMPFARGFRELVVYQKARSLARNVFVLTRSFPKDEAFSLTDQVRRSSRSVGANIAEAWGKRSYERHFISKLTDADAEQYETQHWVEVALDCGYVTSQESQALLSACEEIGRLLGGTIARADTFCNSTTLREPSIEYLIDIPNDENP